MWSCFHSTFVFVFEINKIRITVQLHNIPKNTVKLNLVVLNRKVHNGKL